VPDAPGNGTKQVPLNILLADDHELVRLAIRHALQPLAEEIHWHEAACAAEAQTLMAGGTALDLALIDLHMPGSDGVPTIARWRREHPAIPLVVISADEDAERVRRLIDLGVAGFIPKSDTAAVMLQAVRLVLSGGTYAPLRLLSAVTPVPNDGEAPRTDHAPGLGLTPRQTEVLRLLGRGLPNKSIARELDLSEATVKVHLVAIFRALQVRNRTEAVVAASEWLGRSA
jgi:DNA-binding NarL/FixJ family response regulator